MARGTCRVCRGPVDGGAIVTRGTLIDDQPSQRLDYCTLRHQVTEQVWGELAADGIDVDRTRWPAA